MTESTASKDARTLMRRVFGTMVALMLAGSGLGLLGALVYPDGNANPPSSSDAERRMPESARQLVRQNSVRGVNPTIKVIAHCNNGRDVGALHDAHHLNGRPFTGAAGGRNVALVQTGCNGSQRRSAGRL